MKVSIYRYGFHIMVEPDISLYFKGELSYTRRIVQGMNRVSYKKVNCFDTSVLHEGRPAVCIPAGLTGRVLKIIKDEGMEAEVFDRRPEILPSPDLTVVDDLDDSQVEMLALIINSDHGIIEAPTGSGKSWLIRQVCKIWPGSNVVIVIPGKVGGDLFEQTYRDLLSHFPSTEVGMVGHGSRDAGKRITVAMDRSLQHVNIDGCRIMIYDEVHCASAPSVAKALTQFKNSRRFGFSASPLGRSDKSDLETIAMFGEVIYSASYKQIEKSGRVVPIEVRWVNTDSILPAQLKMFADPNRDYPTVMVERHLIWRNEARNQQLAAAVHSIQGELGPDTQILVVVKTVDHAVHLGKFLPDFRLIYGAMDPNDRVKYEKWGLIKEGEHPITAAERQRYRDEFHRGELKRAIATQIWGTGVDFPKLQVLIRADGQSSPIASTQIPGRVTRSSDGKERGLVVDFSDGFYHTLEDRARRRRAVYVKKEWTIVNQEIKR